MADSNTTCTNAFLPSTSDCNLTLNSAGINANHGCALRKRETTSGLMSASSKPSTVTSESAQSAKPASNIGARLITDEDWVKAPEFVPRGHPAEELSTSMSQMSVGSDHRMHKRLCPYAERDGICKYPEDECHYLHGDMCDFCVRPALHPFNEEQRKKHTQECIQQHERDMELSFAIARSKEKVCGICFEVILQKSSMEQYFGILPNCNHCFCLACIRRWRQAKQFENKIIRACPECRVTSDFVCPSAFWVDTKEEKEKVIENYKMVLSKKDCKYFKQGHGKCPFGNKCFYLHALTDGKKINVGPPPSFRYSPDVVCPAPSAELMQELILEWERLRRAVQMHTELTGSNVTFDYDIDDFGDAYVQLYF